MKPAIEMADTLASLKALALSHPAISITLRNELTGEVEFQSYVSESIEEAYGHLFPNDNLQLVSFKGHQKSWEVTGFFGTKRYYDKSKQFMFVNRRWMKRCKFIKQVANIFKNSVDTAKDDSSSPRRRKMYPVFLVFLECPLSEVEMTLEPRKMLLEFEHPEAILSFIQTTIEQELRKNNLVVPSTQDERESSIPTRGKVLANMTGICALSQGAPITSKLTTKMDRLKNAYGDLGGARKSLVVSKNVLLNQKHFVDGKGLFRKAFTNTPASSTVTSMTHPKEDLMSTILSFRSQLEEKYNFSRNSETVVQESTKSILKKTPVLHQEISLQSDSSIPETSSLDNNEEPTEATEQDIQFRQGMDSAREHILKSYETKLVVWEDDSNENFVPSFESHFTEPPTSTDTDDALSSDCKESNTSMQSRLITAKNTFTGSTNSKSVKRMLLFDTDEAPKKLPTDALPKIQSVTEESKSSSPMRKRPWPLPKDLSSPFMRGGKVKITSVTGQPNVSKSWKNPNFQNVMEPSQNQTGSWR